MFPTILQFIKLLSDDLSFHDKQLLSRYQNHWYHLFEEVMNNPTPDELQWRHNECFCIPIKLPDGQEIEIQFDINRLIVELTSLNLPKIDIETKYFIKNTSDKRLLLSENPNLIGYYVDKHYQTTTQEPIIVFVPNFPYFNFVLDGNHRVDYAIRNNTPKLSCYLLRSTLLIANPHLFGDRLSYLILSLLEDIEVLHTALVDRQQKGIFGRLKSEAFLLRQQSLLPTVQENSLGKDYSFVGSVI